MWGDFNLKKIFLILLIISICLSQTVVFAESNLKIPIIMYHNINDNYSIEDSTVEMAKDEFYDQLRAIKNEGYTTITFDEYISYALGETKLPEKPIILTFDDGYLNNYTVAYPILKEMGMKATIFIITERMGMQNGVKYPHFTWDQAKEMEGSGVIDIESHTNYHNELDKISYSSLAFELRKSKFLIDKHLNKNTKVLAYPYGFYNDDVIKMAKASGYKACVRIESVNPGVNTKDQCLYELKRITAYGNMTGRDLIHSINYNMDY